MQTGNVEAKILEHLNDCDTMLDAVNTLVGQNESLLVPTLPQVVALMQAKSIALVALSNTKAVRINRT